MSDATERAVPPEVPALALRGLGKTYGDRVAVQALELEVPRGRVFGLLGPNGAGKTTTILMCCGVLTPSRGEVWVDGVELAREPLRAKAKLGLVPQELALYLELDAVQNLEYFGALHRLGGAELRQRIDWVLELAGLRERARELTGAYSGGMKRRLNLAAGLLHRPSVLVLDEPSVGVDPQSRNHIFETVRTLAADGMTVVYTSHYMEEVEQLCDRVAIMDGGAVVAEGGLPELLAAHARGGLELELRGDVEAGARAAAALTAITRVAERAEVLRCEQPAELAPLFAAIEGAGAKIARVDSFESNLEAVFLRLTGRALRDDP
ncbi:MAG: ABC transporter ATP-binding protein [Kofleriaceae bacterium]